MQKLLYKKTYQLQVMNLRLDNGTVIVKAGAKPTITGNRFRFSNW